MTWPTAVQEKLSKLQPSCAAQLRKTVRASGRLALARLARDDKVARDQVHAEAEDVRVNFEVSKACEAELHHYCASVKPEGALGCLELHLGGSDVGVSCPRYVHDMSEACPTGGSDFGAPCATAVRATMRLALQDYRLHPQVKAACEPTLPRVCPTVPPGEGAVSSVSSRHVPWAGLPDRPAGRGCGAPLLARRRGVGEPHRQGENCSREIADL